MTLWFVLSLMTVGAVFAVLWPLARKPDQVGSGNDLAVYRDQLDEVRRDRASQSIGEKEAAAAEVEISRRLIAAADADDSRSAPPPEGTVQRRRAVTAAMLALLPLGAVAIYLALGSPTLPDQPLGSRLAASHGRQSIENLIIQVEEHLERRPDDGRGWELIGPIYTRLGRFDDAVKARRNALRLNGETADREAALGEALVFAANGVVTEEAKAAFDRALALNATHVQARYFVALAAEQDGQPKQAAELWQALLADAPPDAPWGEVVRRSLERVQGRGTVERGPTEEQIGAASGLAPDQRDSMIRGMVARLAERLRRDGSDPEGWLRLVRSYMVLGEPDRARAAAGEARRVLSGDPVKLQRFEDLVKPLGLGG
ncbi:MAG TPA: c-type cytochrome biogenesis protein CcmI [Xanthobacteraceae bacterium]|jgi:cytochrome c-type biogenesis protein CcmH